MDVSFKKSAINIGFKVDSIAPPNPIHELTDVLPLEFKAIGEPLIDWRIKGAAGGVGKLGKNYLKQSERSMPDGTYGRQVAAVYSDSTSRTGSFNSGSATNISFRFNASNAAIVPSDIGTFKISDGTTEVELEIRSGHVGEIWIDDDGGYSLTVQCGNDGTGRIVVYSPGDLSALGKWCYTPKIDITPNTDYTFERIGGIEGVKVQYITSKEIGHVDTTWGQPAYLKSIPGNQTPDKNVEQWTRMDSSERVWVTSSTYLYLDSRPATYENCSYFANLPAGHYKVIAEGYGNSWGYTYMCNPDMSRDQTPYMALLAEDDTEIISRRMIFQDNSRFHHEEYDFVLSSQTKVGLYFKAINPWNTNSANYTRFMIVDYDVQAEDFDVEYDAQGDYFRGETCWEPYQVTLPLTISKGSQSTTVTIDLGTEFLDANDTIDFTSAQTSIPTYSGPNTISVDSDIQPAEMYIKYRKF